MSGASENSSVRPEETRQWLEQIEAKLRHSKRVQVLGHQRPDGDCYGSLLGMRAILDALGVEHRLFAGEQGRTGYEAFPGVDQVQDCLDGGFGADLYVFVDSATLARVIEPWDAGHVATINIDHHGSNHRYAQINWVDPARASTAEMIYELAMHMGIRPTAGFANAILLGLMTDTGSFRYSNVGPRQLEVAAELVRAGARPSIVSRIAYESKSPEAMEVTGAVFGSLKYLAGGALAWGEVRSDLVARVGGAQNLPENLSAELRSIRGVQVALLFVELPGGGLRLSLRADGSLDVSRLAARFGGGGHPNAAGLTVADAPYEPTRDRILEAAESALGEASKAKAEA